MKHNTLRVINVGVIYNAFDPTDVKKSELVYRKNTMLKTYLADLPTDCDWKIGLNGEAVDLVTHGKRKLRPNDHLTLVVVPHGGDGFKNVLRIVATIAVAVGAAVAGFAIGGPLGAAVAAGIAVVGQLAVNAILPPKAPKQDKDDSQSYGYDGAKNTIKEGVALPVVYGKYRVGGNYVDVYTQNVGDYQYLYGRTVLSDGRIANVTNPLLNDQPINNFTDVEWDFTHGSANEDPNPWFNRNIAQINKSILLKGGGEYVTHTTTSPVDQIQLNLQFTRGLVHITDKGKKQARTVNVDVEISPKGANSWSPLGSSRVVLTSGLTGLTSKLYANVMPVVAGLTLNQPFTYNIEYRTQGGAWQLFKTVTDFARSTTGTFSSVDFTQVNNPTYTLTPTSNEAAYEWTVPQGQYEIRVTGAANLVSSGYLEASGGNRTYVYRDSRAKVIRQTIESGILALGDYDIRIRKATPDGDNEYDLDELYLVDVGEITNSNVSLSSIATAFYKIKMSEQLNGIPNITWLVEGVEVNKYDIKGNVLTKEWSDNPAWIILDMLIGAERGTPGLYSIDFPTFMEWAEWCDLKGLKFNGTFDSTQTLWDACVDVLKVGHAAFTRIGTKLSLAIDKPQTPSMLFGPGNIFKDTFKIAYLPITGRANEFELSYYDREDDNKQKTIRIVDTEANNRGDIARPMSYSLIGIDNFEQAQKEAWYQLYNNRYLRRTITFDAPIESIGLGIGDVALIQHDMMDWGTSGRISSGSTSTVINLDRNVTMVAGKNYSLLVTSDSLVRATGNNSNYNATTGIMTITGLSNTSINASNVKRIYQPSTGQDYEVLSIGLNGNTAYVTLNAPNVFAGGTVNLIDTDVIEERDVVLNLIETSTVSVTSAFSSAPALYTNFMFGEKTINKKPYRLKSMSGTGFDRRSLTFIEYNDAIYNAPESIVPFPPTSQPKGVEHVSGLQFSYDLRTTEVNTVINGVLSWDTSASPNYGGADVYIGLNGADFVFEKSVLNVSECGLQFNFGDVANIKVVAFNTNFIRAPLGTAPTFITNIASGPAFISPPTNLNVTQISYLALGLVEVTWDGPLGLAGLNIKYRVQVLSTNGEWDEYAATSETLLRMGDLAEGTYSLRIRTERGESYSSWVTYNFSVAKVNGQTITPGATVGGVIGSNIKNPDGTLYVPREDDGAFDTVPPAIPTGLAVTSTLTNAGVDISASWTAPSDADLAGYDLSIKEGSGSYIDFTTSTPRYKFTAQKRNTTYTLKVRAFDKAGNRSGYTAEVAHLTAKDTVPPALGSITTVEAAYNTGNIRYANGSEDDLSYVRIRLYSASGVEIDSKVVSAAKGGGSVIWGGLAKATTYKASIEVFDTSGNGSGVSPLYSFTTAGGVSLSDFADGNSPIQTVTALPNPVGYTGAPIVFFNGKLYRYVNNNWTASTDGTDINPSSISSGALLVPSVGSALNADPSFVDTKIWYTGPGVSLVKITDGKVGNSAIEISGENASSISAERIPLDPSKQYRFHVWVRSKASASNAGGIYTGIALQDQFGNNINGDGTYWLYVAANTVVSTDWTLVEAVFGAGAINFPASARTMSAVVIGNYVIGGNKPNSTHQFQDIRIEEVLPSTLIRAGSIVAGKLAANSVVASNIASNSIAANKLTIGTRPFSLFGTRFSVGNDGFMYWNSGYVQYVKSDGTYASEFISGGSIGPKAAMQYFFYYPGAGGIGVDPSEQVQADPDCFFIGKWANDKSGLVASSGVGTLINGDQIITGSINSNRIVANSITTDQLAAGSVTAANLAAGSILADKLAVGVKGNNLLLNSSGYNGTVGWVYDEGDGMGSFTVGNYATIGRKGFEMMKGTTGNGLNFNMVNKAVSVNPGKVYTFRITLNGNAATTNGLYVRLNLGDRMSANGYVLQSTRLGIIDFIADGGAPVGATTYTFTWTCPAGVSYVSPAIYNWINGPYILYFADLEFYEQGDSTTIANGAITTDKIRVGSLNGDRITAGTIDADRIKANTFLANTVIIGGQTAQDLSDKASNSANNTWYSPDSRFYKISGNKITKTFNEGWDTSAYTRELITGACTVSGRLINAGTFIALSSNRVNGNYGTYDFAWHHSSSGGDPVSIWVNGQIVADVGGYYSPSLGGDEVIYSIVYDGRSVRFFRNDTVHYEFLTYANRQFAGAVGIFSITGSVDSLSFVPSQDSSLVRADPAARINQATTQIDPGKILVSGGTTLANWRQGGDETRIAGGSISANTITANKLTIGNRGITVDGISFQYNRNNGYLTWTDGNIFYKDDNNNSVYAAIAAGQSGWGGGGIRYIYWIKGQNVLFSGTDNWNAIYNDPDAVMLCAWRNGTTFTATYGATIVDGDRITTGSINADRIVAGTISATQIAANSISADRLNVNSLSAISANIGLLRTATSGKRSELDNSQYRAYDENGTMRVRLGVW